MLLRVAIYTSIYTTITAASRDLALFTSTMKPMLRMPSPCSTAGIGTIAFLKFARTVSLVFLAGALAAVAVVVSLDAVVSVLVVALVVASEAVVDLGAAEDLVVVSVVASMVVPEIGRAHV